MSFDNLERFEELTPAELLKREQERSAQLETYAADLSRTYSELRRHLHHLTVLHEVTTRIVSALDPDDVLAGVLGSLAELVTYRSASVYLVDLAVAAPTEGPRTVVPANTRPRLRATRGFADASTVWTQGAEVPEDGAVAQAMDHAQSVGHGHGSGASQLVVPLVAGGRALGALELTVGAPLGIDDVRIVELLAAAAAVALQNAHLYQETQRLATTDALTGLSNYRHFHGMLGLEVQRARRMTYPVGLLLMDLDHFKLVNDRHGHPMGDVALQRVAVQLRARLRRTDVIGRLGGEEFGAILPGDSLGEVAVVAEKLRRCVEDLPPVQGGMEAAPTPLTLSLGGASLPPETVDERLLISYADQALYEAKRNGRNQVRLWPSSEVA